MPAPRISVILATHDTAAFLPGCLRSLLGQTFRDFEVIAVDDGSTDGSGELLESWARRHRNVRVLHQAHRGAAAARNAGLAAASGQYVIALDSDDLLPPDAYGTLWALAEARGADVITGIAESFRGRSRWLNEQMTELRYQAAARTSLEIAPALARDASTCNKLIRRALVEREGLRYPENVCVREDLHFALRAYCAAERVTVTPHVVYHYRVRPKARGTSLTQLANPAVIDELLWVHADLSRVLADRLPTDARAVMTQGLVGNIFYRLPRALRLRMDDASRVALLGRVADFLCERAPEELPQWSNRVDALLAAALRERRLELAQDVCRCAPEDLTESWLEARGASGAVREALDAEVPARALRRTMTAAGSRRPWRKSWARRRRRMRHWTATRLGAALVALSPRGGARPIWVIGERWGRSAQDTGWRFFRYLRDSHPEIDAYFVTTEPVERTLQERDSILRHGSVESVRKLMAAEVVCYSDSGRDLFPDWAMLEPSLPASLVGCFLQHGVIALNGMRGAYCAERVAMRRDRLDVFVTSSAREAQLVTERLGFPAETVVCTGLSRFDALPTTQGPGRRLLLMPTWRHWLRDASPSEVRASQYYRTYRALLRSPELASLLTDFEAQLTFCPHFASAAAFQQDGVGGARIETVDARSVSVQDLLASSNLAITDYSSVAFDMAYQRKPVLFYMFDRLRWRTTSGGVGVDFAAELPGPLLTTERELLDALRASLSRGLTLESPYAERAEAFIAHRDGQSCARIFSALSAASRRKRAER